MPSVNASGTILSGSGTYEATDWAAVGGSGSLDLQAEATFKRGVDLALGAEALVGLDASVAKFLAIDLKGQANAAARVRAQVQVPLDLFDEAGLAIRLQAIAEASAGVELAIGLSAAEFIELAAEDPRMRGVGLRLLKALLAEAKIQGGVRAKASVAAMAYANVAMTGRLLAPAAGGKAGFTVAAEAGLGLKAGAGFRVFADFSLDEPGRLVRRCTDIVVDDALDRLGARAGTAAERALLDELRTPAKIALRTCYELGAELGRNAAFSSASAPVVAQRCLEVALEEMQRYLLARLLTMGIETFEATLRAIGFDRRAWDEGQPERVAFAGQLRAMPEDPFEPTAANVDYWTALINRALALSLKLGGKNDADEAWVRPLAMTWAATELVFVAVERISSGAIRGSLLGQSADLAMPPFSGNAARVPPPLIRTHINKSLRPGSTPRDLTLDDLVAFLTNGTIIGQLVARDTTIAPLLRLIDQHGTPAAAMTTLFTHLGGFVSGSGGRVDPQQSLEVVLAGLQAFAEDRLRTQIEPVLRSALRADDPDLQIYVDDVLLASIGFTSGVVFQRVRAWAAGSQTDLDTLREACSAVVMNLIGRSLVVTVDVLLTKSLQQMNGALRAAGAELNRRNGVVDRLAALVPGLRRSTIHDAVAEIFDIAADVFEPLPEARRARIRELLYQVIDTSPPGADAGYMEELANTSFVPNAQAASALAMELGAMIGDNLVRLVERLIALVSEQLMALLQDAIEFVEEQITRWLGELQDVVEEALRALRALLQEIDRLRRQLADASDVLLDQAESFLGILGAAGRRAGVRTKALQLVKNACVAELERNPAYALLPSAGRQVVRNALGVSLDSLLDNELVDALVGVLGAAAAELEGFLADAREIDPTDDVAGALVELLLDRVEDALRDAFGARLRIPVSFRVRGRYDGPRINTPFGSYRPRIEIDLEFDLGEVRIEVNDLVHAIRLLARNLQAVTGAAHDLGATLVSLLDLERLLEAHEVAAEDTQARHDAAKRRRRETQEAVAVIDIRHPGPAAAYGGNVPVDIALDGVPHGFLGLEDDEQPRLLVFLNDVLVPANAFDVSFPLTEASGSVPGVPALVRGDIPVAIAAAAGSFAPWATGSRLPRVAQARGASAIDAPATGRMTGFRRAAHPVVDQKASLRAYPRGRGPYELRRFEPLGEAGQSMQPIEARGTRREPYGARPGLVSTRGGAAGGLRRDSESFPSFTLGRKPHVLIADVLDEIHVPDLVLRGVLDASSLREGLNSLCVVVSNGNPADRLTQSVVFHWSPSATTKSPVGMFRPTLGPLPGRVDIGPDLLAPALRAVAASGKARRSARGNSLEVPKSKSPVRVRDRKALLTGARRVRAQLVEAPAFSRALGRGEAERIRAARRALERSDVADLSGVQGRPEDHDKEGS